MRYGQMLPRKFNLMRAGCCVSKSRLSKRTKEPPPPTLPRVLPWVIPNQEEEKQKTRLPSGHRKHLAQLEKQTWIPGVSQVWLSPLRPNFQQGGPWRGMGYKSLTKVISRTRPVLKSKIFSTIFLFHHLCKDGFQKQGPCKQLLRFVWARFRGKLGAVGGFVRPRCPHLLIIEQMELHDQPNPQ